MFDRLSRLSKYLYGHGLLGESHEVMKTAETASDSQWAELAEKLQEVQDARDAEAAAKLREAGGAYGNRLVDVYGDTLKGNMAMKLGDDDADVQRVKVHLKGHGYLANADGELFDEDMKDAVVAFQKSEGMTADGIVDSHTLKALEGAQRAGLPPVPSEEVATTGAKAPLAKAPKAQPSGGTMRAATLASGQPLYNDLMKGLNNSNLCIAMVANAIAESGLKANNNGDGGDYARARKGKAIDTSKFPTKFHKPARGWCCSFGLWQFNICGGLGIGLLKEYGLDHRSPAHKKVEVLTNRAKQIDFMIKHVRGKTNTDAEKSIDDWVAWFVEKVERPADIPGAIAKRQTIAGGLTSFASNQHISDRINKISNLLRVASPNLASINHKY